MFPQILTKEQVELLPMVAKFSGTFGLVGGTAAALQIGHRRSVDFDLFCEKEFDSNSIIRKIRRSFPIQHIYMKINTQLTMLVNSVRMTFYAYPFTIEYQKNFQDLIKMPDLLTIAAMKAFALGGRNKWKDYVDLYFIFRKHSLDEITKRAERIYQGAFNGRLFREQLSYYEDINYSDPVVYLPGFSVSDETVKQSLKQIAVS